MPLFDPDQRPPSEWIVDVSITVGLWTSLVIAGVQGHALSSDKHQVQIAFLLAFISSALWMVGATWPLVISKRGRDSALANGAAAAFALFSAGVGLKF